MSEWPEHPFLPDPPAWPYKHFRFLGRVKRFIPYRGPWIHPFDAASSISSSAPHEFFPSECSLSIEIERTVDYDRPLVFLTDDDKSLFRKAASYTALHFSALDDSPTLSPEETVCALMSSEAKNGSSGYGYEGTKGEVIERDATVLLEWWNWHNNLFPFKCEPKYFTTALKREFIREQKLKSRLTRLFMVAPLFHHLSCISTFWPMLQRWYACTHTWSTVGRSFQYGGWDHIIRFLGSHGIFLSHDFANYDMSLFAFLFQLVAELCCSWTRGRVEVIFALFAMALHTIFVRSDGVRIQKRSGNPSGWLLTIFLNTMVLCILICAWVLRNNPAATFTEIFFWIRCLLCGDDSVVRVHPKCPLSLSIDFATFVSVFGMHVKQLSSSTDILHVDYCGSSENIELDGVYVRCPRFKKFLDELMYSKSQDPFYYLQRARGIYAEAWTHYPTRVIIRRYLESLQQLFPLAMKACGGIPTDRELRYLHTGQERAR